MQILSKFCHNKHLTHSSFVTRNGNASMTILSSCIILPITMHKCIVIQQCYFYLKTCSYSQKYYYKLKG